MGSSPRSGPGPPARPTSTRASAGADVRDRLLRIRRDDERRQGERRHVWFLNDPIEDNPDHSWEDYRTNWESTLTASLLWPQVWRYEVMPWPERIFHRRYPTVDRAAASEANRWSGNRSHPLTRPS